MLIHHLPDRSLVSFGLNTTFSQASPPIAALWHHAPPITRLDLLSLFLQNWLTPYPSEDEICHFLLSHHIIAKGSSCHFFSSPEIPLIFQGFLPNGALNLLDRDGKTVDLAIGSILWDK